LRYIIFYKDDKVIVMKKILAIVIVGMFLMLGATTVSAVQTETMSSTGDGINFAIEDVTYEPQPPNKGEIVTFHVTVSFEGWDKIVKVQLYCNGNEVEGSYNYAHPDMPTVDIYYQWPNSDSGYTIKIMVDPDERYEETDETDNTWEETISAGGVNQPPSKPTYSYDKDSDTLTVSSTDPNPGDTIRYGLSWNNDRNVDKWTEYYASGVGVSIDCEGKKGPFGVIAEDNHGAQSDWATIKSKSKQSANPIVLRFLGMFPNAFPLLKLLLTL
jgi:hypothetical protein